MMKILVGGPRTQAALRRWMELRIRGARYDAQTTQCIGLGTEDKLIAVAAYYSWAPEFRVIEMAFAADDFASLARQPGVGEPRTLLGEVFLGFPFRQLGAQRITLLVPAGNASARRFVRRFGFVEEGIARRGFLTEDAIVYGMLVEEAERWLAPLGEMKGAA